MVICPKCGKMNENDAEFCVNCGVDLYSIVRERRSEVITSFYKRVKERVTKPKAKISIALSQDIKTIRLGEVLTGTLQVTSEEEFDANEIRVEIIIDRGRGRRSGGSTSIVDPLAHLWSIRESVSGPRHFTPGYWQEYRFSVKIPEDLEPSVWWLHNPRLGRRIRWIVRGVIDIKKRPNVTSKGSILHTDLPL